MFGGIPFYPQVIQPSCSVKLNLASLSRKPRKVFTEDEDNILRQIMTTETFVTWELVAQKLYGRTARQCRDRWLNYLSPNVRKSPWTVEEDKLLIDKINELGTHWSSIAKYFDGRSDNHIKNRWYSHLKNHVKTDEKGRYVLQEPQPVAKPEEQSTGRPQSSLVRMDEEAFWETKLLESTFGDLEDY